MTLAEAEIRAQAMGLVAWEDSGWCLLRRPGEALRCRGRDWRDCFETLDLILSKEGRPAPAPAGTPGEKGLFDDQEVRP